LYNKNMKPLLIAHRGDSKNFPENSIEAFESAFQKGADGIEFDVQCNKNQDLVIVHNYTHDPSLEYPFLEDILKRFSMRGRLEIEIKSIEEECVQRISKSIYNINPPNIEITSSELPVIPTMRKFFPDSKIGLIFNSKLIEDWMPLDHIHRMLLGYMKLTNANVLHLGYRYCSKQIVDLMHDNGYLIHTHLQNSTVSEYKKALDLGMDQCSFDDVRLLALI